MDARAQRAQQYKKRFTSFRPTSQREIALQKRYLKQKFWDLGFYRGSSSGWTTSMAGWWFSDPRRRGHGRPGKARGWPGAAEDGLRAPDPGRRSLEAAGSGG